MRTLAFGRCTFALPELPEGMEFEPRHVHFAVDIPGTEEQVLYYVPTAAGCAEAQGGWHFDDPVAPTSIALCSETCAALAREPGYSVILYVGCGGPVPVPP